MASANESSSLPIGLATFKSRAANPSKKSKIAAIMTKYKVFFKLPSKTLMIPKTPMSRLATVSKLGICLMIFKALQMDYVFSHGQRRYWGHALGKLRHHRAN